MWWEHGKERLLEKVNSLEELAMHEHANLIRAVIGVLERDRDEFLNEERSIEEAARYTDVSSGQLRRDITDGKLRVTREEGTGPAKIRLVDVQAYRGTRPAPRPRIVRRGFDAAVLADQLTRKRSKEDAA
jgi:hypothetical protein